MPEIIIGRYLTTNLLLHLKVYNATDEGSNPRQHLRSVINIGDKTAGLIVQELYAAVALFAIQSMKNEFLTGTEVDRHLNMIQVIVRDQSKRPRDAHRISAGNLSTCSYCFSTLPAVTFLIASKRKNIRCLPTVVVAEEILPARIAC
ncbi:MAG: hypothetical protein ACLUS6_17445 [Dysosmobacter sp.]